MFTATFDFNTLMLDSEIGLLFRLDLTETGKEVFYFDREAGRAEQDIVKRGFGEYKKTGKTNAEKKEFGAMAAKLKAAADEAQEKLEPLQAQAAQAEQQRQVVEEEVATIRAQYEKLLAAKKAAEEKMAEVAKQARTAAANAEEALEAAESTASQRDAFLEAYGDQ